MRNFGSAAPKHRWHAQKLVTLGKRRRRNMTLLLRDYSRSTAYRLVFGLPANNRRSGQNAYLCAQTRDSALLLSREGLPFTRNVLGSTDAKRSPDVHRKAAGPLRPFSSLEIRDERVSAVVRASISDAGSYAAILARQL
jgi:hypothetical protein